MANSLDGEIIRQHTITVEARGQKLVSWASVVIKVRFYTLSNVFI